MDPSNYITTFIMEESQSTDFTFSVSHAHISKSEDAALDKAVSGKHYAGEGISLRNGPVMEDTMDVDEPVTKGNAKRKSRTSTGKKPVNYNVDGSDSDDAVPLVRYIYLHSPA